MKKKIILSIISIVLLLGFTTGCDKELIEEKQRNEIIRTLENENLIDDSWSYVDLVIEEGSPLGGIKSYNYVYKDINNNYYIVSMGTTLIYKEDIKRNNINVKANTTYYYVKIGKGEYEVTTETRGKYKYTNKTAEIDNTKEISYYLIHYEDEKAIVEEEIHDS